MFEIIFFCYVQAAFTLDSWMHTIQLFGSDAFKNQPALSNMQILQNFVAKQVVLEDGREITCHIPLDPQFRVTSQIEQQGNSRAQMSMGIKQEILNNQQAIHGLFPLVDQCAYHFTKEFIWEYCFKKYVRQFDDEQTVKNANKIGNEEFFVGFGNAYDKLANKTIGVVQKNQNSIALEADSMLIIDGQIAKVRNYGAKVKPSYIEITVSNYEDIAHQSSKEFLKLTKFKAEFRGYIIKLEVLCMITQELFLLKEFAPFRIITNEFKLVNDKSSQKTLERDKIYIYKNYIFGVNLMAHSYFTEEQTIAIQWSKYDISLAKVSSIIDGSMIEIQQTLSDNIQLIAIILLEQKCQNFTYLYFPLRITIFQRIIFASNQYFQILDKHLIQSNDGIMIINSTISSIIEADIYFVSRIYSDGIIVLKNQFSKSLYYEGPFIIRKQKQDYLLPFYRDKNEAFIISSSNYANQFNQYQQILSTITLNKKSYQKQSRFMFRKHNPLAIGFSFKLSSLKQENFLLILKVIFLDKRKIEIVYLSHPFQNIIIREFNTRGEFKSMDPRFQNQTLASWNYWVVLQDHYLYIGKGYYINQQNLMLSYPIKSDINDEISLEITDSSYGLKIYDIRELKLENFHTFEYKVSETSDTKNFTALNFTLGESAVKKIYIEQYVGGTFCSASNTSRSAEVKIICKSDSLLHIIKINEPSLCSYKLEVGTWLLCGDQNVEEIPKQDNGQQMICVLNEK